MVEQDWTLDQLGNWATLIEKTSGTTDLDQDRTANDVNEITAITETTGPAWIDPVYDAAGNLTEGPKPGAETTKHKYVYDAWNRLVKVTNASDTSIAEFEYDGLHRRIVKAEYVGGSLDKTRHFYYSRAWQVLEERIDTDTNAHKQYVWGTRYIDDLVLRDRDADGNTSLEERLYVTQDALFNVTALTNDFGAVQERFQYSAYGESTVLNPDFTKDSDGTDFDWEFRFTGQRLDTDTGLQQSRYRYYHASLGRFVNRDPIGYRAGTNLYNYVGNSPVGYWDPFGLEDDCAWWIRYSVIGQLRDIKHDGEDIVDFVLWGKEPDSPRYRETKAIFEGAKDSGYNNAQAIYAAGSIGIYDALGIPVREMDFEAGNDGFGVNEEGELCLLKNEDPILIRVARFCGYTVVLIGTATGIKAALGGVAGAGKKAPTTGGRLGSANTRRHVGEVADELEDAGYEITGGGGRRPEEYIPGPGGARKGSAYPDITATKDGCTIRINTVDTLKDGVTPTARELRNAEKIRNLTPDDVLILIPKP